MAALNLFPPRAAIGYINGNLSMPVYASTEFIRALNELAGRVGGMLGDMGEDTFSTVFSPFSAEEADSGDMLNQPASEEIPLEPAVFQPESGAFVSEMVLQPPSWGGNIESVTVGASPYAYTAHSDGVLSISGGTVTPFTSITRGVTTITTAIIDGLVPVNAGDVVTVTYTAAPTLKFIPR